MNANKVCLVGKTIARELFPDETPIGKEIRIKNVLFKVVGVLKSKGANMMGMDQDDVLIIPWTTLKNRVSGGKLSTSSSSSSDSSSSSSIKGLSDLYPDATSLYPAKSSTQTADTLMYVHFANIDEISVAAVSQEDVPEAITEITGLLRERHRLKGNAGNDFNIRDMAEMIRTLSATTNLMKNLLLCVALISLFVGGVGIMNIMLVSVTERTREIGLRMAVGARAADILRQFLLEAVTLCLLGGALGIALGHGSSILVSYFLSWPTKTSFGAIAAAILVSTVVGIIFGFYPAWKASKLDPIDALRYE
jgi:ABC-type antimicrobial peptide transport system permease subunit